MYSSSRSASVDLPWSICAMMQKFRICALIHEVVAQGRAASLAQAGSSILSLQYRTRIVLGCMGSHHHIVLAGGRRHQHLVSPRTPPHSVAHTLGKCIMARVARQLGREPPGL